MPVSPVKVVGAIFTHGGAYSLLWAYAGSGGGGKGMGGEGGGGGGKVKAVVVGMGTAGVLGPIFAIRKYAPPER
jgi:hypothetical protein